jgi:hypothetical protein
VNGVWLEVVVEDPTGKNAALLRLNNFTPPKYSQSTVMNDDDDEEEEEDKVKTVTVTKDSSIFEWLPLGSLVGIKNSYSSPSKRSEFPRILIIQCHNPGDVVLLSPKKVEALFPG